jgi:hypothetical protein
MFARSTTLIAAFSAACLAASAQEPVIDGSSQTSIVSNTEAVTAAQVPQVTGLFVLPAPPTPDADLIGTTPGARDTLNLQKFDAPKAAPAPFSNSNVMSRYVVQADRIPQFRLRDVYTRKGLIAEGYRDHPGLLVGNYSHDNDPQAYEMFLEDERLMSIRDYADTALAMTVGGDKREGDAILRAEREAYTRYQQADPLQAWEDAPKSRDGTPLLMNLEQIRVTWIDVRF